jgi:acetyl-CoA acetyltransferase
MRDVAVVSFAQSDHVRAVEDRNEVEMLMPVVREALDAAGLQTSDIGFTCSGSSDYLAGQAFSFVMTLDAVGPWPPISESHVEMDGAWALYEAWVKLQLGEVDTALVYSYGRSSPGEVRDVLCLQLDPYYLAPLWPDSVSLAALQARALLDTGRVTVADLAGVVARSRKAAQGNPHAQLKGEVDVEALLAEPAFVSPLRRSDCPPISDGAAAVVLAAGDRARELCERPAWIRGIDHRIEPHSLGARDLTTSTSTRTAGERAGVGAGAVDVAELHAPFSHQELILREALGLGEGVDVNPSGGPLAANPVMAAGLIRIGEAAARCMDGSAGRAVAHATSGPCLQQNLVCVLEGGS